MTTEKGFKTVKETAKILKLGDNAVYRAIARREIKAVRIGAALRVPDQEIERLQRAEVS